MEINLSEFCPISGDWGEWGIPNLARKSLIECYWMMQNASVTTLIVSELLQQDQQRGGGGGGGGGGYSIFKSLHPPRLELRELFVLHNSNWFLKLKLGIFLFLYIKNIKNSCWINFLKRSRIIYFCRLFIPFYLFLFIDGLTSETLFRFHLISSYFNATVTTY